MPIGAGGIESGAGDIGPDGPSAIDEHVHRAGCTDMGEGVESGSTETRQMTEGFGEDDMGAVDPEIDFGTTFDTVDETELVAEDVGTGAGEDAYVEQRPESGLFRCDVCGEQFFAKRDLDRHMENRHGQLKKTA